MALHYSTFNISNIANTVFMLLVKTKTPSMLVLARCTKCFRRTFAVAGPTAWNLFQNNLREPDMQIDCFCRTLKTFLFDQYSAH